MKTFRQHCLLNVSSIWLDLISSTLCTGAWAQVWRGARAVWHPEGGGHDAHTGPHQPWSTDPSQHQFGLWDTGLLLALSCGSGAEHRIHTGFAGLFWWGRGVGRRRFLGRGWRWRIDDEVCRPLCHSNAGEETHCGLNRTGVKFSGHPGSEPSTAVQHTTDCLLCHQYGPQW